MARDKNTSIVAAGKKFNINCRVILWNEEEGLSFYPRRRGFTPRRLSFDQLSEKMSCFILHHSVSYTAHATFRGLMGRNLSVNFIIDDDINEDGYASIYQCLDIRDYGWSHKPLNDNGPGVEISYHPQAWDEPWRYSDANIKRWGVQPHKTMKDKVHGHNLTVFAPTDAQVRSATALMAGFCRAFPDIIAEFPKAKDGSIAKKKVIKKRGLLAHFHITTNKVDPMGFPFDKVEKDIKYINETWSMRRKNVIDRIREWLNNDKN